MSRGQYGTLATDTKRTRKEKPGAKTNRMARENGWLTCEGGGGDVQPRSREEVGPHVFQVAVDEGGIHLEHLEDRCRFLLPG